MYLRIVTAMARTMQPLYQTWVCLPPLTRWLWTRPAPTPAGNSPPIPGSHLDEQMHREGFCDKHDHFINSMPDTDWRVCLDHCEKIGIGTRSYELVEVK